MLHPPRWPEHAGGQTVRVIGRKPGKPEEYTTLGVARSHWPEIAQLPEIGETLARRIVESREAQGPFADHEQLLRVRGIGPRTLDRLRPYLRPMPLADNVAGR